MNGDRRCCYDGPRQADNAVIDCRALNTFMYEDITYYATSLLLKPCLMG